MTWFGYRQALVVALALALITGLYFQSQVASPGRHEAILDGLREIGHLEAVAKQDILKARAGRLPHYDSLVATMRRESAILDEIRSAARTIFGDPENELSRALDADADARARRTAMIEDFKSDNAVLRNSLGYFPMAAAEISSRLGSVGETRALAREIDTLRLNLLDFYLSGDARLGGAVAARIRRIADSWNSGPKPDPSRNSVRHAFDIHNLLDHANVILDYRNRVDAEVAAILAMSAAKPVAGLREITNRHFESILARADAYRLLLYVVSIAFLCYIAFMLVKLRQGALELQQAKEEADRANMAKTRFLANMSHELRTPLNAVLGFAKMISGEMFGPLGSGRYKRYAEDIHAAGSQLMLLIGDILDVSRVEAGKVDLRDETVAPAGLVASCVKMIEGAAQEARVRVITDVPGDLPLLRADEIRVKQVVLNLLDNGVKFTDAGGEVRVKCRVGDRGGLVLQVTDTGAGIAESDLETALEPFGQAPGGDARRQSGAGLGLALSKSLIELHDGELEVESRVGEGTTVTVRFPPERTVSRT